MALRHAILPIAAVLVLGLGIYLFHEVRATPAEAQPDHARAVSARREAGPTSDEAPPALKDVPVQQRLHHHPIATPDRRPAVADQEPTPPPAPALAPEDPTKPNPKLDELMGEANKAYDHGEFDEAKQIAGRVLAQMPTNVRMLRILVSASCIDGDTAEAQKNYEKLPPPDREQMKTRCLRYGVQFTDPPAAAGASK